MVVKINVPNSNENKDKSNRDKLVFAVLCDREGKLYAHDGQLPENMSPKEFRLKLSEMLATCIGINIAAVENTAEDEEAVGIWAEQVHEYIDQVRKKVAGCVKKLEDTCEDEEEDDCECDCDDDCEEKTDFWDDLVEVITEYYALASANPDEVTIFSSSTPFNLSVIFDDTTESEIAFNIMLTHIDPNNYLYDGVVIKAINRKTGPIDSVTLKFADLCRMEMGVECCMEDMQAIMVPCDEFECQKEITCEECEECVSSDGNDEEPECLSEQHYQDWYRDEYTTLLCAIAQVLLNMELMYNIC